MPRVIVIAGINGAGKTTASIELLGGVRRMPTFVNADAIARGLNGINPEAAALSAGRLMLQQLDESVERREDFSFETTLSGRAYAGWLERLRPLGYEVSLYYYWLSSAELAISRVAARVRSGGHHIPDATVRQRYARSVGNFFDLYKPICDEWEVYDNSESLRRLIGIGTPTDEDHQDAVTWERFRRSAEA